MKPPTERDRGTAVRFWNAVLRVFDMSIGQMLWSRRTVFMAARDRCAGCDRRPASCHSRNGAVVVQSERRSGAGPGDFRRHDLAAVSSLRRPGARRVLWHVADLG